MCQSADVEVTVGGIYEIQRESGYVVVKFGILSAKHRVLACTIL